MNSGIILKTFHPCFLEIKPLFKLISREILLILINYGEALYSGPFANSN